MVASYLWMSCQNSPTENLRLKITAPPVKKASPTAQTPPVA